MERSQDKEKTPDKKISELHNRIAELEKENSRLVSDLQEARSVKNLAERENVLFSLLNASPNLIYAVTSDGKIAIANNEFRKSVLNGKENIVGMDAFDHFPPALADKQKLIIRQVIETKKSITFEEESGGQILQNSVFPIFGRKGGIELVAIYSRDITAERKGAFELQESLQRFRRVFEEGPLGMALVGNKYHLRDVNEKFCRMLGYEKEELQGKSFVDITYPDDLRLDLELVHKLFNSEIESYNLDKRYIRKDGSIQWTNLTVSVIKDSNGQPLYMLSMIQDISVRKRIENLLNNEKGLAKSLIDSLDSEVAILDENGNIAAVNNEWSNSYGKNNSFAGTHYKKAYLSIDINDRPLLEGINEVLDGKRKSFEHQLEKVTGKKTKYYSVTVSRLDRERGGAVVIHTDITYRRNEMHRLIESDSSFRRMINALPMGLFYADENGHIIVTNDKAVEIWGGTRHVDLENYDQYKGWHRDTGKRIESKEWAIAKALTRGQRTFDEIIDIECFNGGKKIINNSAFPVYDSTGSVIKGAVALIKDVTDNLVSQERDAEIRFESLLNNSNEVAARLNENAVIEYVSKSVTPILGYTSDELTGKSAFDLVHPDDLGRSRELYKELLESPSGRVKTIARLRHKKGDWIWCEISGSNLLGDDAFRAIAINFRDTSVQQKDMIKMAERAKKLDMALENFDVGLAILSPVFDDSDEIVDFNFEYLRELNHRIFKRKAPDASRYSLLQNFPRYKESKVFNAYKKAYLAGKLYKDSILVPYTDLRHPDERVRYGIQAMKVSNNLVVLWSDKTAYEECEESLRIYKSYFENLSAGIVHNGFAIIDNDHKIRYVQKELFGEEKLSPGKLTGYKIESVIPAYIYKQIKEAIGDALEGETRDVLMENTSGAVFSIRFMPVTGNKRKEVMLIWGVDGKSV